MKQTGAITIIALSALALAGCGTLSSGTASGPAATVTVTAPPTATVTVTTIPDAPPAAPAKKPRLFPRGYPKVVTVASLPEQVRSAYAGDYTKAVALAPGVWTPLAPGATVMDAATSGVADGFCGSIKTYERKYRHGEEFGGSCW